MPDKSILTLGHPTTRGDIFVLAKPELNGVTGLQLEALNHGDLEFGGPGRSKYGTWALSELEVSTRAPGSDKWEKVALRNATADFAEAAGAICPSRVSAPSGKMQTSSPSANAASISSNARCISAGSSRAPAIGIALAVSITRSTSCWLTSRSLIGTMPRELMLLMWLPAMPV